MPFLYPYQQILKLDELILVHILLLLDIVPIGFVVVVKIESSDILEEDIG